jgi:hypothetical protein
MINNWGHLGGLLSGFFFMFVIKKPYQEGDGMCCNYKIWYSLSAVVTTFFTIIGFILFYILDIYKN